MTAPPRTDGDAQRRRRVAVLVCDSLGIGAAPNAAGFGPVDAQADTLGHVAARVGGLHLPTLQGWGLGNLAAVEGVEPVPTPRAVVARLTPTSAGKDSTTGHWELMGIRTERPFPTYPDGFPPEVVAGLQEGIGRPVLGNVAASGTEIIERLGPEHLRTGAPIVYTSADSVLQIAAHTGTVPPPQLYRWCGIARQVMQGEHAVGRVIARPFEGEPGSFVRTDGRRDFSLAPPDGTVCDVLAGAGIPVRAAGKISDLLTGRGVTATDPAGSDDASLDALAGYLDESGPAFVFVNAGDLDTKFGHRNDPHGYARALEHLDVRLAGIADLLEPGDRLFVTADHGTDPTLESSTDHTREYVPCLAWGPDLDRGRELGTRATMADVGATVLALLGLDAGLPAGGTSFAEALA